MRFTTASFVDLMLLLRSILSPRRSIKMLHTPSQNLVQVEMSLGSRERMGTGRLLRTMLISSPCVSPTSSASSCTLCAQSTCDHTWSSSLSPTFSPISLSLSLTSISFCCSSALVGSILATAGHLMLNSATSLSHVSFWAGMSSSLNHVSTLLLYSRCLLNVYRQVLSSESCWNLLASKVLSQFCGFCLRMFRPWKSSMVGKLSWFVDHGEVGIIMGVGAGA